MPSARIAKTFWVASKRAIPPQMAAIQNHRGESECVRASSITRSYSTVSGCPENAASRRLPAGKSTFGFRLGAAVRQNARTGKRKPRDRRSESVLRRRYSLVAKIDVRLSAMMGDVCVHAKQHFATGHATVRRVVRLSDLIIGKVGDHV